ncbi:MAG: hypothetical protein WAO15_02245 [Mycobacterium sp.]
MPKTKPSSHAHLRARLQRAQHGQEPVRLTRGIAGADVLEGYVLAIGPKWTLLANLADDGTLDGYVAIRTRDIARVQRHLKGDFPTRLLTARGQWPPRLPEPIPPLDATAALLQTLAAAAPTVTVHVENDDPEVCFIGAPVGWTAGALWMQEISPSATWDDTLSTWRYRDVTRVDVGARYEAALYEVAGPPPPALG